MSLKKLEHRTHRVGELIEEYRLGTLVIPEFQRDYVWKPNKAPMLLDSLYQGFPVSSLLVWESDGKEVRSRRAEPRQAPGRTRWLIDGQQRVITLHRIRFGDENIDVVFHPRKEQFARANAATDKDKDWIRVAHIWDPEGFRELLRHGWPKVVEERIERVHRLLEYEIPAVYMADHSFESAVAAFERINTLGVKLKKQDIESARVAARHSGFIRDEVVPVLKKLHSDGYRRVDVGHLFRACAFLAHPDGRARTPLHELSEADVKKAWKATLKGVEEAKTLLNNELGVTGTELLPSGALMVPVIALCATLKPSQRNSAEIAGWVALAALMHRYSASALTNLDQDLRVCRAEDPVQALLKNLRQSRSHLRAQLTDFDASLNDRGALFAVYVACRERNLMDLLSTETLRTDRGLDRHHIFPRAQFPEQSRTKADVVPNIAFIKGGTNKSVGAPSPDVYLRKLAPKILASQCISPEREDWELDAFEDFCNARLKLLSEAFNDFLKRTFPTRLNMG